MFEESDIAGHTDYVNRMEFKGILKRMGFALIDEPEPVSVSSGSAMHRMEEERRAIAGDHDDNNALNDTMGSDDVLMHYGKPAYTAQLSAILYCHLTAVLSPHTAILSTSYTSTTSYSSRIPALFVMLLCLMTHSSRIMFMFPHFLCDHTL